MVSNKLTIVLLIALLFASSLSVARPLVAAQAQGNGWQYNVGLINGLPPFGGVGENCQTMVYNLAGNGQWDLIIGPTDSWDVNQFPFTGYYWSGSNWINDNKIAAGLVAYPNENDPQLVTT